MDPLEALQEQVNSSPYFRLLGMRATHLSEGYARIHLPSSRDLRNSFGTMHGGAIGSLADSAGGVALRTLAEPLAVTTVEFKVNLLAPVTEGELVAEARIVRKGSRIAVAEVEIKAQGGNLVAVALATYMILGQG